MRQCPVCRIENPIVLTKLGRDEYTSCERCGLLYTHKDVTVDDFKDYYDGGRNPDENYHDEYMNDHDSRIRNIALAKEMQIMAEEPWERRDILEIGSSCGYLLVGARELGARVVGLEISRVATQYAIEELEIDTVNCNWENLDIVDHGWENKFDYVLMAHVIEHFVFPVEAIAKIAAVLHVGGAWITQHPDASVHPGVKFHVRDHTPNEHLQIFDESTIIAPAEAAGFKRVAYKQEEPGQSISVFRKLRQV
jgi:hypothetical protein